MALDKEKPAEKPPAFWEFLGKQHLNSDPVKAEAARYVTSRWDLGPWYRNNQVLRALTTENSEHLRGLQLLVQDYSEQFQVEAKDQLLERLGSVSPLVPVGRENCRHAKCTADALPGAGVCSKHGGSWITEAERAAMATAIQDRLVDLSSRAISVLADLMDNARSEKVRLDAAVAVLDRAGLGAVNKIELSVTEGADAAANEIKGRLLKLHARASESVVDGEVVPGEPA